MKIALLNVKSDKEGVVNKDLAGGLGTRTIIGDSIRARLIEFAKRSGVRLPVISLAYIAAILDKKGHLVDYKESVKEILKSKLIDYDLVIINTSIVDFKKEIKVSDLLQKRRIKNSFYWNFLFNKAGNFYRSL